MVAAEVEAEEEGGGGGAVDEAGVGGLEGHCWRFERVWVWWRGK